MSPTIPDKPFQLAVLLRSARLPFLVLAPVSVLLGWACADRFTGLDVLLVVLGALSTHVSVNAFNEYFDFRSGLDQQTQRTPFSGGSGALPAAPAGATGVYVLAWLSFALAGLIGLYFVLLRGPALLPLGLAGLALVYFYTEWVTRHPLLCLLAPGLGFGPLMVLGTQYALSGTFSMTAVVASLTPLGLTSALLLLNQFPDTEPDRAVGRRHFPIVWGRQRSARLLLYLYIGAYAAVLAGYAAGVLPGGSLWALLTMPLAIVAAAGASRYAEQAQRLLPFMGLNVVVAIVTPLLLALGLAFPVSAIP